MLFASAIPTSLNAMTAIVTTFPLGIVDVYPVGGRFAVDMAIFPISGLGRTVARGLYDTLFSAPTDPALIFKLCAP